MDLLCKTSSFVRRIEGKEIGREIMSYYEIMRGIISYYAIEALAHADTMASWLAEIEEAVQSDAGKGRLTALQKPSFQLLGDPAARVPGRALSRW